MSQNLAFKNATNKDRPAILHVLRDAFRREAEAKLVESLWQADAIFTELVAIENDLVVGYCAFSPVTADPEIAGLLLGLAPLAVLNEHQGKGIGKALAMRGLEICQQHNPALMVVLGEPEYYSRFGFLPATDLNLGWATMEAGRAFQAIDFGKVTSKTHHMISYHPAFLEV